MKVILPHYCWNNRRTLLNIEVPKMHMRMDIFRSSERRSGRTFKPNLALLSCTWISIRWATRSASLRLATNIAELSQLDGLRGEPEGEFRSATAAFRAMPLEKRIQESKAWSCWAMGLKMATATALQRHLQRLDGAPTSPPSLRPLNQVALEAWKQHFLHDHLPARRDCMHCVCAQGRSRPHSRITHPDAFTLSVDLSGKMVVGKDQDGGRCRYIMVACYTFPVTGDGRPLLEPPGTSKQDQDQPLPSMDLHGGGDLGSHPDQRLPSMDLHGGGGLGSHVQAPDGGVLNDDDEVMFDEGGDLPPMPESAEDLQDPQDPLREQSQPEPGADGLVEQSMRSAFDLWHRLVEDAQSVGVKNLTFMEVIPSRAVKDVLPALARVYARLRYLGLPLLRIHCDRARELTSAAVHRWAALNPPLLDGVPTRRLRGKTAMPLIRSMRDIEGEDWGSNKKGFGSEGDEVPLNLQCHFEIDDVDGSGESSWTIGTDDEQTSASSQADTPTLQSDAEELGGGEWEEAPNNRCGGSCPVASISMSGVAAIRALHANVVHYIEEEIVRLDATTGEQSLWIGAITDAIQLKSMLEGRLQDIQHQTLQTKMVSKAEVWSHLDDWEPSIRAEFEQLVNTKGAVKQVSKAQLQQLAQQRALPIELLPAKMESERKSELLR